MLRQENRRQRRANGYNYGSNEDYTQGQQNQSYVYEPVYDQTVGPVYPGGYGPPGTYDFNNDPRYVPQPGYNPNLRPPIGPVMGEPQIYQVDPYADEKNQRFGGGDT